ncbi:23S rRNA (uracil(1939)-C(5))-methyltransferase RlmD [Candidatus Peregrinibacteria bacterium]|nr:23S rRNA (uracil(1939)-C(5))-methyltransferase RlmD [Candidatus Peregrinibacteria bacterium]
MYKKGDKIIGKIEKLVFGGAGVMRVDGGIDGNGVARRLTVFVEGGAPGDEVEVEFFSLKRNLAMARIVKMIKPSEQRIEPRCKHFLKCGGCSWQFLSYQDQLKVKSEEVFESLVRTGGIDREALDAVWKPILFMEDPWYYRNKMEFSFNRTVDYDEREQKIPGTWQIGLHMKGRYYDVCEIEECYLFRPWIGEFLNKVREWLPTVAEFGGQFSSLIVRRGTGTGEVMINLLVENGELNFEQSFLKMVEEFFAVSGSEQDKLTSVFLTQIINIKGQRKEWRETLLWGAPVFKEKLNLGNGRILTFDVAPQAFLQPNTVQAERFYALIRELAGLDQKTEPERQKKIFDLYCGTGTIGIALADKAASVVGIELNSPAVENARINAEQNGVKNMEFIVGDVARVLPERGAEVDLVVVDPPRAGLHNSVIATIAATRVARVIYVSCNPATLARDLKIFLAAGFTLEFVQPVDQFCHTYHVETVVLLSRAI